MAESLNRTGRSTEKSVLERLDSQDPELAEEVRNQMFVFDDIAKLTDREIQMILREVDAKDLAIALKGASQEVMERIFSNVSVRVGTMIKEEMARKSVRLRGVVDTHLRIMHIVHLLAQKGQVTVAPGGDRT